ncbi:MAG: hypothetical protein ABS81_03070 [Pseudonocardia sp. SCN 72-86]|nr:MAG: hypothetical protein ABS81_03070 [Pseudonocardia sp. SCN 72-86]
MAYYRATVRRTARVTPGMIRVTLGGDELTDYDAKGLADDYCRVLFPHPGEREPVIPVEVDGAEQVPQGAVAAPVRNYTIRRHDRVDGEVDIDFVVHAGGVGATWAREAVVGDSVALTPAHGTYQPPADAGWEVLVGDATALPAMGRIVEELPAGRRAVVVGIVEGPAEEQLWHSRGDVEVRWLHEASADKLAAALTAAVRDVALPEGTGYVWVAGEAAATRAARKYLRHELGLPGAQYSTLGYWRFDDEAWERRYKEVATQVDERLAAANEQFPDDDDYYDAVDKIYEDHGL